MRGKSEVRRFAWVFGAAILLATSGVCTKSTGKIVGKVTDAGPGKGLPGASVIIVGTKMGAATEIDGSYIIINVPIGTYALQVSLPGHQTATVTGVRTIQGKTTRQDIELEGVTNKDAASLVDAEPPQIESSQLKGTVITPTMEQEIQPGKNVLYCSTLQIAWNALEDEIIKEKIRLEGDPPVVKALNKRLSSKEDLSENSYVAKAELLTDEFLSDLNKTLKAKFGDQAPPEVREPIPPGPPRFMAYAYLFKNLQFNNPFELLPDKLLFYSGDQTLSGCVIAFGIDIFTDEAKYRGMGKQVKVIEYLNYDHFIIELQSKSLNDQILLAKVKPGKTLLEIIEDVERTAAGGNSARPRLKEWETVCIPVLNFNVNHTFPELSGKRFANKGKEEWTIDKAVQWTRFKLNQKGALLKSEARMTVTTAIGPSPNFVLPRQFIFDKPFLVYLKQKGAKYPYFAMWVGNTELMVKAK